MATFGLPQFKNPQPTISTTQPNANSSSALGNLSTPPGKKIGGVPVSLILASSPIPEIAAAKVAAPFVRPLTSRFGQTLSTASQQLQALRNSLSNRSSSAASRTGFRSSANDFADKSFQLTRNQAPGRSSSVPQSSIPRAGASDIKPTSVKPTTSSTQRALETKTTTNRQTPKIDTRLNPTRTGTTGNKFPMGKIGLGLGASALGYSLLPGSEGSNFSLTPQTEGLSTQMPTGNTTLTPDQVFRGGTNTEGGVFESSFAAPQSGTAMGGSFQPGTPAGGIGAGSYGGAPVSPFTSVSGNTSPREEALEELLRRNRPSKDEERARGQEDDLARRIAELTGNQELENLEIEGEPIAADARLGRRNLIDRETRRSLVPLQTSLALVQALRERSELDRNKEFEAEKYAFEQRYPQDEASAGFTLGAGQQRYARNATTGAYEIVGSVPDTGQTDKLLSPTEAAALGVAYGTTQSQAYGQMPGQAPTATQKARTDAVQSVIQQLQNYRNLIDNTVGWTGANFTGADAATLRTAKAALEFAIAQAVGTGALQAPDRAVVMDMIPDPASLAGGGSALIRGQKQGQLASLDEALKVFQMIQGSIGSNPEMATMGEGQFSW